MKKYLGALFVLIFHFGLVAPSCAILFEDIKHFGVDLPERPAAGQTFPGSYSRAQDTAAGFKVSSGPRYPANLNLAGKWIDDDDPMDVLAALNKGDSRDSLKFDSGFSTVPPEYTETSLPWSEPAAMLLLGSGLIVIAGYGRKKLVKKSIRIGSLSQSPV